jgi:poly-beta-hydroxybutyrate-responsive repressor
MPPRAQNEKKSRRTASTARAPRSRLKGLAEGIFRLRGDLLAAGILANLRGWNAHGYQLARELVKAGLPILDSGTLYRMLRDLERAGLVSSFWDTSSSGPARRMYSITKAGEIFLANWTETLQRFQAVFQRAAGEIQVPSAERSEQEATAAKSSRPIRQPAGRRRTATREPQGGPNATRPRTAGRRPAS